MKINFVAKKIMGSVKSFFRESVELYTHNSQSIAVDDASLSLYREIDKFPLI